MEVSDIIDFCEKFVSRLAIPSTGRYSLSFEKTSTQCEVVVVKDESPDDFIVIVVTGSSVRIVRDSFFGEYRELSFSSILTLYQALIQVFYTVFKGTYSFLGIVSMTLGVRVRTWMSFVSAISSMSGVSSYREGDSVAVEEFRLYLNPPVFKMVGLVDAEFEYSTLMDLFCIVSGVMDYILVNHNKEFFPYSDTVNIADDSLSDDSDDSGSGFDNFGGSRGSSDSLSFNDMSGGDDGISGGDIGDSGEGDTEPF